MGKLEFCRKVVLTVVMSSGSEEEKEGPEKTKRQASKKKKEPAFVIESDSEDDDLGILYLNESNLSDIPRPVPHTRITKLVLSRNRIKDGNALQFYSELNELNLDLNQLKAKFFYKLKENSIIIPSLRILYINKNEISNLDALLNCLCEVAPNLEQLSMMFNPCNDNPLKYQRYRTKAIFKLTSLQILDSDMITNKERQSAMQVGRDLFSAKPQEMTMDDTDESDSEETQIVQNVKSAAYIGKGKIKYDGRESEGNRFITNVDL